MHFISLLGESFEQGREGRISKRAVIEEVGAGGAGPVEGGGWHCVQRKFHILTI